MYATLIVLNTGHDHRWRSVRQRGQDAFGRHATLGQGTNGIIERQAALRVRIWREGRRGHRHIPGMGGSITFSALAAIRSR
jgi:hypothetical protein